MTPQQKYDLIISRQAHFQWGDVYIPSTLVVPGEAPKGSRVSKLNSRKLGRTLHALSTPERIFTQLALHHPALLDIHEQKMLSPVATVHPLRGHPLMIGKFPTPLPGTLKIATEIGFKHYKIVKKYPDGRRQYVAFPYQGDLLLYMIGCDGNPYAVNWSVKDTKEAFSERRRLSVKTPAQQKKDRDHAELRAKLEAEYYARAGIRTVQVAMDMIDPMVIANLDLLFGMHSLPVTHESQLMADFSCAIQEAFTEGVPLAHVAIKYGAHWGSRDQFLAKIYQDIWERKLPVNFFKPILIDHPLCCERKDLFSVYGELFEEFEA
ncbi:hypothetical protein ACNFH5_11815 [Pseudomonas sp. NY15435]|uniref:hypothetical protein n=1 Tax=Pseudomonas sp. NY15435 TaxID=3400358 RepID=UPI003A891781